MNDIAKMWFGGAYVVLLAMVVWAYWRLYRLYWRLGDHVRRLTFMRFMQQLRYPSFSRNFAGHVDFESGLPDDLREQVAAARRLMRFGAWVAGFFIAIFVGFAAVLISRGGRL